MHRESPAATAGEMGTEAHAGPAVPHAWRGTTALLLAALALGSRAPWSGSAGEPDCARYLLGMMQWLRAGSSAHSIYAKVLSPGYYAAGAWLVGHTGVAAATLLSQVSLWAAVASAPLLYYIGRQLVSEAAAVAGTALYLLAPGFWWLGLETHPQGVSFLCLLVALACYLPARHPESRVGKATLTAAVALGVGMLLKNDLIVSSAIFPALQCRPRNWRRMWGSLAVPAGGLAIFLPGRQAALGLSWGAAQQPTTTALREFLSWPHGSAILKQVLPLLTAPGVATLGFTAAMVAWGYAARTPEGAAWRRRWSWLLAAWVLPQLGFWMAIRGNNARHMAAYILLPLWAALEWSLPHLRELRHPGWVLGVGCALALIANALLIPPSSNTTLFPSGNVPGSRRDLAARSVEMRTWLEGRLGARAPTAPAACFLGNPTLPYLELALLQSHPGATLNRTGTAAGAHFVEANSPTEFRAAAAACRSAGAAVWSIEYSPTGQHQRFLGEEIGDSLRLRHWYPGGRARLQPRLWK